MADQPAGERTEKPTPERLKKAREEGKVAVSQELPSALMIGGLLAVLALLGGPLVRWFSAQLRQGLSGQLTVPLSLESFGSLLVDKAGSALLYVLPFLLACAAVSVLGSLLVSGWAFSPKALKWDWSRIAFGAGLKQLVSVRSLVQVLVASAKMLVLLVIVHDYLKDRLGDCLALARTGPEGTLAGIATLLLGVTLRISVALLAIAAADMIFQKWKFRRDLRMSRQEVIDERKQHELAPSIRGRIRAIQFELARRRMLQDVPKADVVITNPTHVAVALKYELGQMTAPTVVAKGADLLCQKIKEIARAHDVPVVERPELARMLYASVELNQVIPDTLFVAVAEVLAMIYRLRRQRR